MRIFIKESNILSKRINGTNITQSTSTINLKKIKKTIEILFKMWYTVKVLLYKMCVEAGDGCDFCGELPWSMSGF